MIKALIFDVGGVLVRTVDQRPRTLLADMLGVTYAELEFQVYNSESGRAAQLGRISTTENWENVRRHFGLALDEMDSFRQAFWGGDVLDVELVHEIRRLRPHYRTAILSNNFKELRTELASRWGIADAFDLVVNSAEEGVMKPSPRIFEITLERLGVAPPQAIFVDDFLHNIQGAQSVGLNGILFRNRAQLLADLEKTLNA